MRWRWTTQYGTRKSKVHHGIVKKLNVKRQKKFPVDVLVDRRITHYASTQTIVHSKC